MFDWERNLDRFGLPEPDPIQFKPLRYDLPPVELPRYEPVRYELPRYEPPPIELPRIALPPINTAFSHTPFRDYLDSHPPGPGMRLGPPGNAVTW